MNEIVISYNVHSISAYIYHMLVTHHLYHILSLSSKSTVMTLSCNVHVNLMSGNTWLTCQYHHFSLCHNIGPGLSKIHMVTGYQHTNKTRFFNAYQTAMISTPVIRVLFHIVVCALKQNNLSDWSRKSGGFGGNDHWSDQTIATGRDVTHTSHWPWTPWCVFINHKNNVTNSDIGHHILPFLSVLELWQIFF